MAEKKKTPSPKVLAAKWVLNTVRTAAPDGPLGVPYAELAAKLSALYSSRVNPAKADKVILQAEKLLAPFVKRLTKIVENFEKGKPDAEDTSEPDSENAEN